MTNRGCVATIKIDPRYYQHGSQTQIVRCYPGAVFEGHVKVVLSEPLFIHQLKLGFRATEIINYGAMGRSAGNDNGIVFAIKTNLCTPKPLEKGNHTFPFKCQMPMVNFPSSMQHPMLSSSYTLTATLNDSWKSDPFQLYFDPFVETSPCPKVSMTTYNKGTVSLLTGMYYQIHTDTIIRVQVPCSSTHYFVYLKRFLTVGQHHVESMVVSSAEGSGRLELSIPRSLDLPSISHSSRYRVEYKVCVYSAKALLLKRKVFDIPVTLGTLPLGTRAPADLLSYADDGVFHDMTARAKPMLCSSTHQEEEDLPPYDNILPPGYPLVT